MYTAQTFLLFPLALPEPAAEAGRLKQELEDAHRALKQWGHSWRHTAQAWTALKAEAEESRSNATRVSMEAERARQAEEEAQRQITLLQEALESLRSGDNPHLALHQLQLLHRLPRGAGGVQEAEEVLRDLWGAGLADAPLWPRPAVRELLRLHGVPPLPRADPGAAVLTPGPVRPDSTQTSRRGDAAPIRTPMAAARSREAENAGGEAATLLSLTTNTVESWSRPAVTSAGGDGMIGH